MRKVIIEIERNRMSHGSTLLYRTINNAMPSSEKLVSKSKERGSKG